MKQILICAFFALTSIFSAYAQNYTGYDYVEPFNNAASVIGTIGPPPHDCTQYNITGGYLQATLSGCSGARNFSYTMSQTVGFTKKLIVEFDWYYSNFSAGGTNEEAQLQFRDENDNPLFTLYCVRGSGNTLGIVTGAFEATWAAPVNETYNTTFTNTPNGAWYHFKVEIYAGQRICYTVTGAGTYNRQAMHPVPHGFLANNIKRRFFTV